MQEIYFDNASTTRVDDSVVAQMTDVMKNDYGNPSSLHSRGVAAERRIAAASEQLLAALGAKGGQVVFTSGGTEANNLALFGAAQARQRRGRRIVTTAIEHSSVLACAGELEHRGFEVTQVPPDADGRIDARRMLEACGPDTILVSMMLVNNEVGAIQPLSEVIQGVRAQCPHAVVHSDAVQAFGKLPFSVSALGVDLMTVSGHKIHAPKGCGALYLAPGVRIVPILFGGGQQNGLRPGTESVPMCVALGTAAKDACDELAANRERVMAVRARLVSLLAKMPGVVINSPAEGVSPYLLDISLPGLRSEPVLHFLAQRNIFVSSGSACARGEKSHVLKAMGKPDALIDSALRISLCKYSTPEQADGFAEALAVAMQTIRPAF